MDSRDLVMQAIISDYLLDTPDVPLSYQEYSVLWFTVYDAESMIKEATRALGQSIPGVACYGPVGSGDPVVRLRVR